MRKPEPTDEKDTEESQPKPIPSGMGADTHGDKK